MSPAARAPYIASVPDCAGRHRAIGVALERPVMRNAHATEDHRVPRAKSGARRNGRCRCGYPWAPPLRGICARTGGAPNSSPLPCPPARRRLAPGCAKIPSQRARAQMSAHPTVGPIYQASGTLFHQRDAQKMCRYMEGRTAFLLRDIELRRGNARCPRHSHKVFGTWSPSQHKNRGVLDLGSERLTPPVGARSPCGYH